MLVPHTYTQTHLGVCMCLHASRLSLVAEFLICSFPLFSLVGPSSEREVPDSRTGSEEKGFEIGVLVTRSSGPNSEAPEGNNWNAKANPVLVG